MIKEPPKGVSIVPVQPHSLVIGLDNIARAFRVRRETAKRWYLQGAPIKVVNGVYRADTMELWSWIPDDNNHQYEVDE